MPSSLTQSNGTEEYPLFVSDRRWSVVIVSKLGFGHPKVELSSQHSSTYFFQKMKAVYLDDENVYMNKVMYWPTTKSLVAIDLDEKLTKPLTGYRCIHEFTGET